MVKQIVLIILLVGAQVTFAQEERSLIRDGNAAFEKSDYLLADSLYGAAKEKNPTSKAALYNRANSLYEQKKYDEAIHTMEDALPFLKNNTEKANAYHNIGNAHLKNNAIEKAIEAYKNALRCNPNDVDARYNLAYAKSMLTNSQKQKGDNNENEKGSDKNQEEQNKQEQQNDGQDGQKSNDEQNPNEQQKGDDKKPNDDKKGNKPDNEGEKDKSKEGSKEEKDDGKGDEKSDKPKDSDEKKGEEENGKPGGKEGQESDEKSEQKGNSEGEQDNNKPQKVKAISKEQANELLKQLENNEEAIREKMIRSQMKNKPRQKIDKDW